MPGTLSKILKKDSLAAKHPTIARQWHPTKNGTLKPSDVGPGSGRKFWWKCDKKHEWQDTVSHRASGRGCPYCSGRRPTKDNNLAALKPEIVKQWHPTRNQRLSPKDILPHSSRLIWWKCSKGHEWQARPQHRSRGQNCPYCSGHRVCKDNSLATLYPKLARQWHKEKNGKLTAKDVRPGSNKRVWWKCSKGHEYQAMVIERRNGNGCPYCSGQRVGDDNNLAALSPSVAKEWHPTHNGKLTASDVTLHSNKRVWWRCKKGHEWKTSVNDRSRFGCPYCTGRKACKDNCLQTLNPKLAREWHPSKNGKLTPKDVTMGSSRKVWWKCRKGHSWQAPIAIRKRGHGCPYCAGLKPDAKNNLAVVNPKLAKEWHPTKNGDLTPCDVTAFSNKKYWWKCAAGHEWQNTLSNRNGGGHQCPYCTHQAVSPETSFATLYPKIAKEWNRRKNGKLKPSDVMPSTHRKVWWRCKKGHEYFASVAGRTRGSGCPYCSDPPRRLSPEKSLAVINPELAKEWHPVLNGGLTPEDVFANAGFKVWWLCRYGHAWSAVIASRNSNGRGCPDCYRDRQRGIRRKVRKGWGKSGKKSGLNAT